MIQKRKGTVVILEDDSSIANAMKEIFIRNGFEVFVSSKSEVVKKFIMENSVNTVFVDCFLPGISGVDFVLDLRKKFPPQALDVVIMSGLFTDAAFIKDTLRATKAVSFLKKPFELNEALSLVKPLLESEKSERPEDVSPIKELYQFFNEENRTSQFVKKLTDAVETVHGFDLLFIYSILIESKVVGHLNIVNKNRRISGVSFADGKIVGVDISDSDTHLGKLLIQSGFLTLADLEDVLKIGGQKKIGEKLIHANMLSPHALEIVLRNQMLIRLAQTIENEEIKINFILNDFDQESTEIDSQMLSIFLHDCIASKVTLDWLRIHFSDSIKLFLRAGPSYSKEHSIFNMPLLASLSGFVNFLLEGKTLNQILDSQRFPEEAALRALYFLIIRGVLIFEYKVKSDLDSKDKYKFLIRTAAQFEGKKDWDIVELLASIVGVKPEDSISLEREAKKILGERPGVLQPEVNEIWEKVDKIFCEAIQILKFGDKEKYREQAMQVEIEEKLKISNELEKGRQLLIKSSFSQAYDVLKALEKKAPNVDKLKIYIIWAKLGMADSNPEKKITFLMEVESALIEVPPEERFDAVFSFILGLQSKVKGDYVSAKKHFEKVLNLEANFMSARREINIINQKMNKKNDVLSKDLKEIVAGFFKKG